MLHRIKTIGKSKYSVISCTGGYKIMETYHAGNETKTAFSRVWQKVDDALSELQHIDRERYYTDPFKTGGFNI